MIRATNVSDVARVGPHLPVIATCQALLTWCHLVCTTRATVHPSRYAWDKCTSGCSKDGVSEYTCPSAAAAYNDLAGNEQGTPAFIVGQAGKKAKYQICFDC